MVKNFAQWWLAALLLVLPAWMGMSVEGEEQQPAGLRLEALWKEADKSQTEEDYSLAEQRYKAILAEFPKSQRAALRIAVCQQKQGKLLDSLASYDRAIAIEPRGQWAPVALFYRARTASEQEKPEDALASLERLAAEFPDSSYVAQGRLLVAQMTGKEVDAAQAALARELEAAGLYDDGMKKSKGGQDEEALVKLSDVIVRYPNTATALRSREAVGHILFRYGRDQEAVAAFQQIVDQTRECCSRSRIFDIANARIAALKLRMRDREGALEQYTRILENSQDPAMISNAALQAAGAFFEILQHQRIQGESVSDDDWSRVRELCDQASSLDAAEDDERVRAELMSLESRSWQRDYTKVVEFATAFILRWEAKGHSREVETARFFRACALRNLGEYDAALGDCRQIVAAFPGRAEIWPNMDHIPRRYNLIFDVLVAQNAPTAEVEKVVESLVANYPESPFSARVLSEMRNQLGRPMASLEQQVRDKVAGAE